MPTVDDYIQQSDGSWKLMPFPLSEDEQENLRNLPGWIKQLEAEYEEAGKENRFKRQSSILLFLGCYKRLLICLKASAAEIEKMELLSNKKEASDEQTSKNN